MYIQKESVRGILFKIKKNLISKDFIMNKDKCLVFIYKYVIFELVNITHPSSCIVICIITFS